VHATGCHSGICALPLQASSSSQQRPAAQLPLPAPQSPIYQKKLRLTAAAVWMSRAIKAVMRPTRGRQSEVHQSSRRVLYAAHVAMMVPPTLSQNKHHNIYRYSCCTNLSHVGSLPHLLWTLLGCTQSSGSSGQTTGSSRLGQSRPCCAPAGNKGLKLRTKNNVLAVY